MFLRKNTNDLIKAICIKHSTCGTAHFHFTNLFKSSKKVVLNLQKEAAILTQLRHTNVIQFSGVLWEPPLLGIAMPLARHGSLSQFVGQYDIKWPMKVWNDYIIILCISKISNHA